MPFQSAITDYAEFIELYSTSMLTSEIATHFGVRVSCVHKTRLRLGLGPRPYRLGKPYVPKARKPSPPPKPAPKPAHTKPPPCDTLEGRLIASQGRYAALAEIGDREGWTAAQTMQRYHRARTAT